MKNKKLTKLMLIILIPLLIILVLLIAIINSPDSGTETTNNSANVEESSKQPSTLRFGELLSVIENEGTVVVKAKINSSYSNEATITQNYYNIVDLVKNQGYDKYSEIQYWAVADMNDGSEQKVISFTVSDKLIKTIATTAVADNQLGSYVDDLWIHPSLRK